MRYRFSTPLPLLLLSVVLTGCLPSSCNRVEPRDITAADSTSRALALSMPVDTLEIDFVTDFDRDDFVNPRTVLFAADGDLLVSDTRSHVIHRLDGEGEIESSTAMPDAIPYLAGAAGDTMWVFSPRDRAVHRFEGGERRSRVDLDLGAGDERALQWVIRTETGFVSKVLDDSDGNRIAFHDKEGAVVRRVDLSEATWRYAGLLRSRGSDIISLSGFLPWVFRPDSTGLDSTRLSGFDSPMLARTLQFERGSTNQPPLLSGSSALAGDWMFLLNMRPGWLHIDVYDADFVLRYVLTQPDPGFNKEYYPTDIAVRQVGEREFELAVTLIEPVPGVERYRWTMPERDFE